MKPEPPRALMIDNYDSFTFNVVQYLQELGCHVEVVRNDEATTNQLIGRRPNLIVLSPGPSTPDHAGMCLELIPKAAAAGIPLLGICLGHQAIGQAYGASVVRALLPMHGKVSSIKHSDRGVFQGLPQDLKATRYHSLIVDRGTLPPELEVTAETEDGIVMGLRHTQYPLEGIQFHPESVLTEHGLAMLANFVRINCST